MKLSDIQKKELLDYARQVLIAIATKGTAFEEEAPDANYLESAGVFVSLHKGKELRGCIGFLEPIVSIWDAIAENTIAAATKDYRFSLVAENELADIKIEISILTKPKPCRLDEIEIGKSGVIIEQGRHKATYLPQVWESLPGKEEFFGTLCEKAGLDNLCWNNPNTKFYKYDALAFSES